MGILSNHIIIIIFATNIIDVMERGRTFNLEARVY